MMEKGIYLYCFARANSVPRLDNAGLDNPNPLFQHPFRGITVVVSEVPMEEFTGPEAESRMKDLSWVAPRAIRHEEVVELVMRHSPVLPVRFGTIFSSLPSLEIPLQRHHDAIFNFLEEVTDREEWVLKALVDREKAKDKILSQILAEKSGELAALAPGIRYLREQRIRSEVDKEFNRRLKAASKEIAKELQGCVADFCERRLLSREVTGNDCDMVLNWAFLVPRPTLPDFKTRIDQANADYAKQGLHLELSGPWPPYSFALSLEPEAEA